MSVALDRLLPRARSEEERDGGGAIEELRGAGRGKRRAGSITIKIPEWPVLLHMKLHAVLLHVSLMASTSIFLISQTEAAVQYKVINNAKGTKGSTRFEKEIGVNYTLATLAAASQFTWKMFKQGKTNERKNYTLVRLYIDNLEGIVVTKYSDIFVSAPFIANFRGDVKDEFTRQVYHAAAHVWQWWGNEQAPEELIHGIADFVMMKAEEDEEERRLLLRPQLWKLPTLGALGSKFAWNIVSRFLEFFQGKDEGFVAKLNQRLQTGYSDDIFVDLTGMAIDKLWKLFESHFCGCPQPPPRPSP
ncbi:hypothetical protein H6P81_020670 [Aristolochia fimbriata]|uniref:Uncharacterized protein n=1 Tax=Aristolochia fimbriata TaxID=158543 RepID=A0AAV7DV53_ARIFI|nr:hypothetical protein H6P81_020670 [Aristolochia fimbriata]